MLDNFLRLGLVLLQAYAILFALIGAHRLRRRYGLDLYFILVGGLLIYMWWMTRLGIDTLQFGELDIPVASVAYFSSIFAALLLVYVSDGARMARRLIVSVVALQALFLLLEVFTQGLIKASPPLPYPLPQSFLALHWQELVWSSVALVADMVVLILVYQFLQNRLPHRSPTLKLFLALAVALTLDSLIFVTGTTIGETSYWVDLLTQGIGKWVMAALIAPPLSFYIQRESGIRDETRNTFDIFRSVDELSRSLHVTKTKHEALLSLLPSTVLLLDEKGFLVETNAAFFEMFGIAPADSQKLHYTSLIHADNRPLIVADNSVRLEGGDVPEHYQIRAVRSNGSTFEAEFLIRLIRTEARPTGVLIVISDTSHLYGMEYRLQRATQLAAISDLQAQIASKTLDPLDRLNTVLHQLSNEPLSEADRDSLQSEFQRLRDLLSSLGDALTGLEVGDKDEEHERIPVEDLIKPALNILSDRISQANITIHTDYGSPAATLSGSRRSFIQLFLHLLDNATHWATLSPDPPQVNIRSQYRTLSSGRRRLEIQIEDKGPGFDPESTPRLADPFYTTDPDHHVGLGLAFVNHVVSQYGGRLELRREDNRTIVRLIFPLDKHQHIHETWVD